MIQTIQILVAGEILANLQVFSGRKTKLENQLLQVGAPVYRIVPGTDDNLVVSSRGVVLKRKTTQGGRRNYYEIVKPCYNKVGYLQVNVPNIRKTTGVHRLVAQLFLPKPGRGQTDVDHINHIRDDNRLENLRWTSHEENCNSKRRHSL